MGEREKIFKKIIIITIGGGSNNQLNWKFLDGRLTVKLFLFFPLSEDIYFNFEAFEKVFGSPKLLLCMFLSAAFIDDVTAGPADPEA